MKDSDLVAALFLGLALGALTAWGITYCAWERTAVNHGHAEYYLDEHYERQWRWKETK